MAKFAGALLCLLLLLTFPPSSSGSRGWNSWDNFLGNSDESDTMKAATYMKDNLLAYSYDLITIDEGWYWLNSTTEGVNLDSYGRPLPRVDQYPSAQAGQGFLPLSTQIHDMGLRLGVWSIRGIPKLAVDLKLPIYNSTFTCDEAIDVNNLKPCSWSGYCVGCKDDISGLRCNDAAYAYYRSVAVWYKEQGLDLVKMDCLWPGGGALNAFDHDIVAITTAFQEVGIELSMSPGSLVAPENVTFINENELAVQMRVTDDFWDFWLDPNGPNRYPSGLRSKLDKALEFSYNFWPQGPPSALPDLDMLPLGDIFHAATGPFQPTSFTHDEQQMILTLWCATGAPLIFGGRLPLDPSDSWTLNLLTAKNILRVHNESSNRQPLIPQNQSVPYSLYSWQSIPMTLPQPSRYISLYNAQETAATITVDLEFDPTSTYCATDLWTGARLPASYTGTFSYTLNPHAAGMYLLALC